MAFGRACASAPRAAGKPLAEASSTLANRACLNRGADGEANCAHRSAASGDRDAQRGGAERRGGAAAVADRTADSSPMAPSGTVVDVPEYRDEASADRFLGGGTLRKHRSSPVASVGNRGGGDVDNFDQQEPPDFDDALDYDEDETDGLFYRQGDNFIKIWDASAYVDCAAMPEDEWSDDYDRAAIEARSEYYCNPSTLRECFFHSTLDNPARGAHAGHRARLGPWR